MSALEVVVRIRHFRWKVSVRLMVGPPLGALSYCFRKTRSRLQSNPRVATSGSFLVYLGGKVWFRLHGLFAEEGIASVYT